MPVSLSLFDQFTTKWNGKPLEYNHDGIENQCMDEFYQYLKDVCQIDPRPFQGWGSAKRCWDNFAIIKGASQQFQQIKSNYGDSLIPQKGDIVFWKMQLIPYRTGFAGHVAQCESANQNRFTSFDQNYPTGSVCHFQVHDYRGVVGWLRKL